MSTPAAVTQTTLTDRDIATSLLTASKSCCEKLCMATLEAASPDLYRLFHSTYDTEVASQRKIYEYMHQKNWYDPYKAPHDMAMADLTEAKRTFS